MQRNPTPTSAPNPGIHVDLGSTDIVRGGTRQGAGAVITFGNATS